jgi:hypothetical protein
MYDGAGAVGCDRDLDMGANENSVVSFERSRGGLRSPIPVLVRGH